MLDAMTQPQAAEATFPAQAGEVPVAVSVRAVEKEFKTFKALHGVSLDIGKGEFFSLLGPSGCGKTTLMRIIGGFEAPTAGDVQINGQSVVHLAPHSRPTNMVFQSLALFPHLNVRDNIAFGLKIAGLPKEEIARRVDRFLKVIHLERFADRPVTALSGGQQQRVAIARALVNEPEVLLLDEPLSALDSKLREEMQVELRRIQKLVGSTFIFVTHDQAEAMSMSDRIAVMSEGHVQQVGTPEELYSRPKNRFVAHFIGHSNLIDGVMGEDGASVETPAFTVKGAPAQIFRGYDVTGTLRFEDARVLPEVPAGAESLPVTVIGQSFHGAFLRVQCQTAEGLELTADMPPAQVSTPTGSTAFFVWEREKLRILLGASAA